MLVRGEEIPDCHHSKGVGKVAQEEPMNPPSDERQLSHHPKLQLQDSALVPHLQGHQLGTASPTIFVTWVDVECSGHSLTKKKEKKAKELSFGLW